MRPVVDCQELSKLQKRPWQFVVFPHEYDCSRFYECADEKNVTAIVELTCADRVRTRFDPYRYRCEWNHRVPCITYYEWVKTVTP